MRRAALLIVTSLAATALTGAVLMWWAETGVTSSSLTWSKAVPPEDADPGESCRYDADAETMTATATLTARTTGAVAFTVTAGVMQPGAETETEPGTLQRESPWTGTAVVDVDVDGAHSASVEVTFTVPREAFEAGWSRCYLVLDHTRRLPDAVAGSLPATVADELDP